MQNQKQMQVKEGGYTLLTLKLLHEDIVWMKDGAITQKVLLPLTRKIREFCQMIIWGEKNGHPEFFEFFCESKVIRAFFELFIKAKYKQLIIEIIKSISMLLVNLTKQESINYFVGNTTIKNFLMLKFPQMHTDIAEYYVNFLKTLSLKIDEKNITIFYNKKFVTFSLAWQAIRFYNHPQSLIRNTSRNIILSLVRINNQSVERYFSSFPFVIYYSHFSYLIKEQWVQISDLFYVKPTAIQLKKNSDKLCEMINDNYDLLLYVLDFLKSVPVNNKARKAFLNAFLQECVNYMIKMTKNRYDWGNSEVIGTNVVLYFLGILLKVFQNQNFVIDYVIGMIFGKFTSEELLKNISNDKLRLISHMKNWSFKGFWDKYDRELEEFCTLLFEDKLPESYNIQKKLIQISQTLSPQTSILNTYSQESTMLYNKRYKFSQIEHHNPTNNINQKSLVKMPSITNNESMYNNTNSKFLKLMEEIQKIEKIQGITLISNERSEKTTLEIFSQLLQQTEKLSVLDLIELKPNKTFATILEFLESKDENLVMLTMEILINLLRIIKKKGVSESIIKFCGFFQKQQGVEVFKKVVKNCVQEVLNVDPPNYRLSTIVNAIELIKLSMFNIIHGGLTLNENQNEEYQQYIYNKLIQVLETVVDRVRNYLEPNKVVIDIFQKSEREYKKIRTKSHAAYGFLLNDAEIMELYQKSYFSFEEKLARDFHNYFLLRQLMVDLYPNKFSKFGLKSATSSPSQKNSNQIPAKNSSEISWEQISNSVNCTFKITDKDKSEKCKLVYLKDRICVCSVIAEQDWTEKFVINYYDLNIEFDSEEFKKLRINCLSTEKKMLLIFENVKTAASNKLKMEQRRMWVMKTRLQEIDNALQW